MKTKNLSYWTQANFLDNLEPSPTAIPITIWLTTEHNESTYETMYEAFYKQT